MPPFSISYFDRFIDDQRGLVEWLGQQRFLNLQRDCPRCRRPLALQFTGKRPTDLYWLRCNVCKHTESIRSDSPLELFHEPLIDLMRLAALFVKKTSASAAASLLQLNRKSVSSFYSLLRELMSVDLDFDPIRFSKDDIVEIDEMLLEALRGGEEERERGRTTGWIFGIVSRDSGQVHLEIVSNREANTLLQVMKEHVQPGAIVCSDAWRAYSALEPRYTLRTINKGRGAMAYWDPQLCINVHTGTIEAVWSELRAILHVSRRFPKHYVPLILSEFMYRKAGRDVFDLLRI